MTGRWAHAVPVSPVQAPRSACGLRLLPWQESGGSVTVLRRVGATATQRSGSDTLSAISGRRIGDVGGARADSGGRTVCARGMRCGIAAERGQGGTHRRATRVRTESRAEPRRCQVQPTGGGVRRRLPGSWAPSRADTQSRARPCGRCTRISGLISRQWAHQHLVHHKVAACGRDRRLRRLPGRRSGGCEMWPRPVERVCLCRSCVWLELKPKSGCRGDR